jgi:hypothetical protein
MRGAARREKREALHRLVILLMHLLKWEYQPDRRSASWERTIREQSKSLKNLRNERPFLGPFLLEVVGHAYGQAVQAAAKETQLPIRDFPSECPYRLERLVDD